jgi:hypothetical protein
MLIIIGQVKLNMEERTSVCVCVCVCVRACVRACVCLKELQSGFKSVVSRIKATVISVTLQ